MAIRLLAGPDDLRKYDEWLRVCPEATLWQSLEWKTYQEALGRDVRIYIAEDHDAITASALVIIDRTSFGLSTWEIPRGPVTVDSGQWTVDNFLSKIISDAKKDGCFALYFSPQKSLQATPLRLAGYEGQASYQLQASRRHLHPEATLLMDLTKTEEEILTQMHPKGRYNIKLAQKHGVTVQESTDVDAFYQLAEETAKRDGFTIGSKRQYQIFLQHLPGSFLLVAKKPETPVAALLGVIWNGTGIYYYGASSHEYRALMAPYILQWEAMRRCKALGCHSYDFLGVAPPDSGLDHPWQGISAFKGKFGGRLATYPPEQMVMLRPGVKMLIEWKRRIVG